MTDHPQVPDTRAMLDDSFNPKAVRNSDSVWMRFYPGQGGAHSLKRVFMDGIDLDPLHTTITIYFARCVVVIVGTDLLPLWREILGCRIRDVFVGKVWEDKETMVEAITIYRGGVNGAGG